MLFYFCVLCHRFFFRILALILLCVKSVLGGICIQSMLGIQTASSLCCCVRSMHPIYVVVASNLCCYIRSVSNLYQSIYFCLLTRLWCRCWRPHRGAGAPDGALRWHNRSAEITQGSGLRLVPLILMRWIDRRCLSTFVYIVFDTGFL